MKRPLTDPRAAAEIGPFDRPQLYMESDRVPRITGNSRPGSGGISPQIKAISPPVAGNPNFTVSVTEAIGNSSAVLVIDSVDPGIGISIPEAGSFARIVEHTKGSGIGNGWVSVTMPVPNTAAVVGGTFYARWYVSDPGASNGFSVSRVATFTVFGETAVSAASISGRVVSPNGVGLRSATVTLSGPAGFTQRATTSSFGFFGFENVPTGVNYDITVSSRRYRFAPRNILVSGDMTDVNFIGLE